MDVLSSRVVFRPTDLERSRSFYRDVLGLAIYREFGPAEARGTVFFLGNGLLEISGEADSAASSQLVLWVQVRDVEIEYSRLAAAGADLLREPRTEPWGLIEAHISDPDGLVIHLVQIPADHPLRRDQR